MKNIASGPQRLDCEFAPRRPPRFFQVRTIEPLYAFDDVDYRAGFRLFNPGINIARPLALTRHPCAALTPSGLICPGEMRMVFTHPAEASSIAVSLRFSAFAAQMAIGVYLAWRLAF